MPPSPPPDALFATAATLREQANSRISADLASRGVTDILPAHGSVLHALFVESPLPMGVLAERIARKKNTVTSLIKTLEERGYCRRETDARDARVQLIGLTAKGESLRDIQAAISANLLRQAWEGISPAEQDACMGVLGRVLANLDRA